MTGTLSPGLVLLSVSIAALAAYSSLLTTERVVHARTALSRRTWFVAGSLAMGFGIWTMHFVGMLAYEMNMPVAYDMSITALSLLPGIGASAVALHIMRGSNPSWLRLNVGGLLMGGGIGTMHYLGMTAMVMQANTVYEPRMFAFSILVAHGLATLSLAAKLRFHHVFRFDRAGLAASALLMGLAVAGMHYTAMMASFHFHDMDRVVPSNVLSPGQLGLGVWIATGLILGLSIISSIIDRRLQGVTLNLRASEEWTKAILEAAADGIVAFDKAGEISAFNHAAAEIFGVDGSNAIGRKFDDLFDENDRDAVRAWIATYGFGDDKTLRRPREVSGKRSNGDHFPLVMTVSRFTVNEDLAFAAMMRDISEQREIESKLLQAQKLESIGQLAAGIAHEINTPAQFVSDNLEFLDDSLADLVEILESVDAVLEETGSEQAEATALPPSLITLRESAQRADIDFLIKELPGAVAQSRDGISRVAEIVKAMKDFSHPGAEGFQTVDLNRSIESTVTVARNEWKYVAEVELDLADDLPTIPCHAGEIKQCILNIVVNAAHAIEQHREGTATLGKVRISTLLEDDYARVLIEDDGGGIPETARARVFDPFFTTKGVGKGTGQGLSIAYQSIAEKHGGILDFEVEDGVGTRFSIRLPLIQPGSAPDRGESDSGSA